MPSSHGPSRPPLTRLEFADDMFARRHRGLGSPIVNQWVWQLDRTYDRGLVQRIGEGLAAGGLSRRLHRAIVPGARDLWTNADLPPSVELFEEPIARDEVSGWLEQQHARPLDPHEGRTYHLSAVDVTDGGAVVSLILAHSVGDGGSLVDSVVRAATGDPLRLSPPPASLGERLRTDLADALTQAREIGRWARTRRDVLRRQRATGATGPDRPAPPAPVPPSAPEDWTAPRLVVEFDTATVADIAARHGGSPNSWFIAVVARLLVAIGHVPADGGPVRVSLPMSDFKPGDRRSNSTWMTTVDVAREVLSAQDLGPIRAAAKEAYTRRGQGGPGHSPIPLAAVQMLPDAVFARLPQPPSAACMASSLGTLPDEFVGAFGPHVRSITALAGYQHAEAEEVRALGGGLVAWHAQTGRRSTLCIIAAEPDRIADVGALTRLVQDELAAWGVEGEIW